MNREAFFITTHLILIIFQGVWSFQFLEAQTPWKLVEIFNAVPNVLVNRKRIILTLICMTSTLHCPGSSGLFFFFFFRVITRESEIILPLFLSYSFLSSSLLFGIKIYETFYRYKCLVSRSVSRYTVHVLHRFSLQSARSRCHVKRHLAVLALKKHFAQK